MGKLSVIGTPIGNLEDITLRALAALAQADVVLCEDTRVTKKLLARYSLPAQTLSYHTHSGMAKVEEIIGLLRDGKHLALVSDAGTPAISDPGALLVSKVREALPDTVIEAVPGPSALAAALSIAGVPASEFLFLGFLPHKKGRETLFREIAASKRSVVFYESPHRIEKALESLKKHAPERAVSLGRELTKMHEEVLRGTADELLALLKNHPEKSRGEFVVIVSPR